MIDTDLMNEVMAGEFSPAEPSRATLMDYLEQFGWANLILDKMCPALDPDALVFAVENDIETPNMVFHAAVFDGPLVSGNMVGEPFVKIVSREAVLELIQGNFAEQDLAA